MSVKKVFERIFFWGLIVPLMLGIAVLAFVNTRDSVAANSITTGKIIGHEKRIKSSRDSCEFAYRVDGERYEAQDGCYVSDYPIGTKVTIHYIADEPSAGFLGGDETWGDKLRAWGPFVAAGAGIVGLGIVGGKLLQSRAARARAEP